MRKILKYLAKEAFFKINNLMLWLAKLDDFLCDYAEIDLGE